MEGYYRCSGRESYGIVIAGMVLASLLTLITHASLLLWADEFTRTYLLRAYAWAWMFILMFYLAFHKRIQIRKLEIAFIVFAGVACAYFYYGSFSGLVIHAADVSRRINESIAIGVAVSSAVRTAVPLRYRAAEK